MMMLTPHLNDRLVMELNSGEIVHGRLVRIDSWSLMLRPQVHVHGTSDKTFADALRTIDVSGVHSYRTCGTKRTEYDTLQSYLSDRIDAFAVSDVTTVAASARCGAAIEIPDRRRVDLILTSAYTGLLRDDPVPISPIPRILVNIAVPPFQRTMAMLSMR
jgi:hypothetical protein